MKEKKIYRLPEKSETPFVVPEPYFAESFQQIVARAETSKEIPFRVPPLYFEALEERINDRLLPEEIPFQTPEDYFDQLSKNILARKGLHVDENTRTLGRQQGTALSPWYWGAGALAAALALIVVLFIVISPPENNIPIASTQSSEMLLAAIDKNTARQYMETSGNQHEEVILEIAEQKNIKLPEFGDQKISEKEKEQWKQELELEDLDDLDLEM